MNNLNYYSVLNVSMYASADDIKHAYRLLVKQYHPDKNPGDAGAEKKTREINEAYNILSDAVKRAQYNQKLWEQEQRFRRMEAENKRKQAEAGQRYNQRTISETDSTGALVGLLFGALALGLLFTSLSEKK